MTNGPGEMQRSETVKMEETQAVNTLDETANLKIDDDLLMDKNGKDTKQETLENAHINWVYLLRCTTHAEEVCAVIQCVNLTTL